MDNNTRPWTPDPDIVRVDLLTFVCMGAENIRYRRALTKILCIDGSLPNGNNNIFGLSQAQTIARLALEGEKEPIQPDPAPVPWPDQP